MRQIESRRVGVNPYILKNHSMNHAVAKLEREGSARLEPSGPVARIKARRRVRETQARADQVVDIEKQRQAMFTVRRVAVLGNFEGITPQLFAESLGILRNAGLTDEEILSAPVYEVFPSTVLEE